MVERKNRPEKKEGIQPALDNRLPGPAWPEVKASLSHKFFLLGKVGEKIFGDKKNKKNWLWDKTAHKKNGVKFFGYRSWAVAGWGSVAGWAAGLVVRLVGLDRGGRGGTATRLQNHPASEEHRRNFTISNCNLNVSAVLQIRDVYPRSRILTFNHTGSRI